MPHWLWILLFILAILLIILFLALPFSPEGRERIKYNKTKYAFALLVWLGAACYIYQNELHQPSTANTEQVTTMVGHKVNKSEIKKDDSGAYYTDKDDSKLRYFTSGDSNKVTAAKYVYGADHMNVTDVKNKLSDVVLHDDNLKYTDDKTDSDDFLPKGASFNVYSPKNKKWYHVSMQRDSSDEDAKVSSFSIWPGKDNDVDDY